MRSEFITKRCKLCGKPVGVIERGVYRKVLVDASAVELVADPDGEEFIRYDGSKVRGREATIDEYEDYTKTEFAFRPHQRTCVEE